eukprot:80268-Rhodomonas_salina.2
MLGSSLSGFEGQGIAIPIGAGFEVQLVPDLSTAIITPGFRVLAPWSACPSTPAPAIQTAVSDPLSSPVNGEGGREGGRERGRGSKRVRERESKEGEREQEKGKEEEREREEDRERE